ERDVPLAADAGDLALKIGDLLDCRLGIDAIRGLANRVDHDLDWRACIGCADEIGESAVGDIQGAGRNLLGGTRAYNQHVDLETIFLEPTELGRDVFGPLQGTMAYEAFNDLVLSEGLIDRGPTRARGSLAQIQIGCIDS